MTKECVDLYCCNALTTNLDTRCNEITLVAKNEPGTASNISLVVVHQT